MKSSQSTIENVNINYGLYGSCTVVSEKCCGNVEERAVNSAKKGGRRFKLSSKGWIGGIPDRRNRGIYVSSMSEKKQA